MPNNGENESENSHVYYNGRDYDGVHSVKKTGKIREKWHFGPSSGKFRNFMIMVSR